MCFEGRGIIMKHIFLVEDDKEIARNLALLLDTEGFAVIHAASQKEALEMQMPVSNRPDLALVDISLPDGNGFTVCTGIKQLYDIPVIFLTASGDEASVVTGLNIGADDYITKPFEVLELLARVENVLRRFNKTGRYINIAGLDIDTSARIVKKNNEVLKLTYKEYDLLLLFARNPGTALYRETIYERVWDSPYMGDSRTVDLHVQRLRKKAGLEKNIEAVYKVGYRFVTGEDG